MYVTGKWWYVCDMYVITGMAKSKARGMSQVNGDRYVRLI